MCCIIYNELIIDFLGNEKNTDEEADTVGCCSLRVEHIKFEPVGEVEGGEEGSDEQVRRVSQELKDSLDKLCTMLL